MPRLAWISALLASASLLAQQSPPAPKPADATKAADAKPADAAKLAEPLKDKPFADVIKGAEEIPGLFTLYKLDDKVFLEIQPAQLNRTYMLSITCSSGLGERGFYASMMCGEIPFRFQKVAKNIHLVTKSPIFTAEAGSPIRRAVDRSFAPSILGSAKIESAPHPGRKSVLIELGPVFLTDLPMASFDLERNFRIPYRFDAKNSSVSSAKAFPLNVELETRAHYAADRPPLPPLLAPGAPPPPSVPPPRTLGDPRSMLLHFHYSVSELPEGAYMPRLADDRVGHFFTQTEDFSTDNAYRPTKRYISRWRLEKSDSSAELSPPKEPIVFWLENTIPAKYRGAIREGALLWNKAFERIGFKDAVQVRQQPDDADWDPADVRYNSIRWLVTTDAAFAIGPSRHNPYTGQKYDSDIGFAEALTRVTRNQIQGELKPIAMPWESEMQRHFTTPWTASGGGDFCTLGEGALFEAQFGFEVLAARGLEPDSPEAEKYLQDFLRYIAAHEVGHTLGLRHNFRGSAIHTLDQNQDAALTAREGLSASVMDYLPSNISPKGGKQGEYYQSTIGPYDYWAIEYAYKPIPGAKTPEEELPELRKIASRAAEPLLAYATDEDAGVGNGPFDIDPTVSRFDLGSDPLEFSRRRVALSSEIVANMESKLLKPGDGYQTLRRAFQPAFNNSGQAMFVAAKYIGGVSHYRDHFGDPGGRLPFQPVPAAKQKEALTLLRKNLFAADAFRFSPQLLNKLAAERDSDYFPSRTPPGRFDVPIHQLVLSLQQAVLNRLLHPVTLSRILDSEVKVDAPGQEFRLSELFLGLQEEIWSELKAAKPVTSYRRSLQREHLKRMTNLVLRDGAAPEDARTMARYTLAQLQSQIRAASANAALPLETRAHYSESAARIEESLKAQAQRTAF